MSTIETGGPVFPTGDGMAPYNPGMTLRQYAAIHLNVPNSGTDWLDNMILESLRDNLATKAMQGLLAQSQGTALGSAVEAAADYAYVMADAMLKARQA